MTQIVNVKGIIFSWISSNFISNLKVVICEPQSPRPHPKQGPSFVQFFGKNFILVVWGAIHPCSIHSRKKGGKGLTILLRSFTDSYLLFLFIYFLIGMSCLRTFFRRFHDNSQSNFNSIQIFSFYLCKFQENFFKCFSFCGILTIGSN